jgi:DNA processing protein
MSACDACLRRSHLLALLAPRVTSLLREPPERRPAGVLDLPEDELIGAVAGGRASAAERMVEGFDGRAARAAASAAGAATSCRHGVGFPERLLGLADPPAVLYRSGAGGAELLGVEPAVTIVGTRRASGYGLERARTLARDLAQTGIPVVSGLALGIDAAAHDGALGGGPTIAVLAGGPDVAYPRSNRRLHERILREGLVVSEMPPGTRAERWGFPARNRIMAALGAMTVVVEAGHPSGSLITSRFATALGRTVGAVPGRVTARMTAGSNRLLRDGARVVLGVEDVLEELYGAGGGPLVEAAVGVRLATVELAVLDAIEAGVSPTELVDEVGLGPGEARGALARLESAGLLARRGLGGYERTSLPAHPREEP